MKRIRIGDTSIPETIPYWTGGKRSSRLRQSEKEIYSAINLYDALVTLPDYESKTDYYFTEMDKLFVFLCLIEQFGDDSELLEKAGMAVNQMILDERFISSYDSLDARNDNVNQIVKDCIDLTYNIALTENFSPEFIFWWQKTVLDQNYYWNETTGEQVPVPADSVSVNGNDYDEYSSKLVEGGLYYVYIVCDSQLINTAQSLYKKQMQYQTLDKLRYSGVGLSYNVMLNNINQGILQKTGTTPDTAVNRIKAGKSPAVGWILEVIAAVVAIISLVNAILAVKKANIEKQTADILSKSNIEAHQPDMVDFNGDGIPDASIVDNNSNSLGIPTWLLIAGAATAIYLIS